MRYLFLFLFFANISSAYALSCAFPDVEGIRKNSSNIFLIEVKSILDKNKGECYVSGSAEIEVQKIYKGDIEELKDINVLMFSEDGNNWPNRCFIPFGLGGGEKFILFKSSGENLSIHRGGDCHVDIDMPVNDNMISEFEKNNNPIWVRE